MNLSKSARGSLVFCGVAQGHTKEGLLFATQRASGGPGAYVETTYRDPLGITETTKAVYDPLGNYTPFQAYGDPHPPAGSYSSASMSGLSSSQANNDSYAV